MPSKRTFSGSRWPLIPSRTVLVRALRGIAVQGAFCRVTFKSGWDVWKEGRSARPAVWASCGDADSWSRCLWVVSDARGAHTAPSTAVMSSICRSRWCLCV